MKNIFLSLMFLLLTSVSMAQPAASVEMADGLRSSGMIYVVVTVMTVIFAGLVVYLFSLDGRLKKIERTKAGKN